MRMKIGGSVRGTEKGLLWDRRQSGRVSEGGKPGLDVELCVRFLKRSCIISRNLEAGSWMNKMRRCWIRRDDVDKPKTKNISQVE